MKKKENMTKEEEYVWRYGPFDIREDSDGTLVAGWDTVTDQDGNIYPVKDRD